MTNAIIGAAIAWYLAFLITEDRIFLAMSVVATLFALVSAVMK